jgi:hypothetical protein
VIGPIHPLCEGVDCGDHGTCDVVAGDTVCECDEGYEGEQCDACASGEALQGGECVSLCDADDAPDCGVNGECAVDEGTATCRCEHPFGGEDCTDCAEGFALQTDGSCKPDCGACGAHSFCNETLMTPSCECVAGYAKSGADCTWVGDGTTGGIVDGDLDVPSEWTTQNVTFQGGAVSFDNALVGGTCRLGAIEQTIHMPAREDAEALVLDIDARTVCTSMDSGACPALLVDIADSVTRVTMAGGAAPVSGTLSVCLGDAAFQDEVLLRIRPGLALSSLSTAVACTSPWPSLERVRIRSARAGECPADASLLGSLASQQGWSRRRSAETGTAKIENNKLTVTSSFNAMSTLVSVPAAGGLAVRVSSAVPGNVAVLLDGLAIANGLPASPATVCLPEYAYGSVHSLGFSNASATAEVTQLSVGFEAACSGSDFDGGFERSFDGNGWTTRAATVTTHADGSRGWRASGAQSAISGTVLMPGYGEASKRPALNLRSRVGSSSTTGHVQIMGAWLSTDSVIEEHSNWVDSWTCLDPAWLGQPTNIFVIAYATLPGGTAGTPYVWIDRLTPALVDPGMCD